MARRLIFACQFGIGESLPADLGHGESEALAVVHVFAVVESEGLFVKVAEKMKRFDRHIRARDAALEQRPEVLKAVRVYAAIYVLNGMIHNLVRVIGSESLIGKQGIGVESRASFDMLADFALQCGLFAIRYDRGANLPAALQDAHDSSLVLGASSGNPALALTQVHVSRLAADERFVYFDFASEFASKEIILDSKPKALQHEPCRLLSDTQSAVNLHTGDAVLAIDQQPKSSHPLIESERRILKNCSQFQCELFLAFVAKPDAASLNKRVLGLAATGANNLAIGPAEFLCVLESAVWIGEVNDGFLESVRRVHEENYSLN